MRGVVVIVVLISYLSFIHCCFSYCTRNTSIAQFKYARKYLADANGKSLGTPIRSRKYSNDVIIPFTSFLLLFTALRNNDSYSDPGIVFGLSPSDIIVNPMILNTSSTKPINSFVSDSAYGSANSAPNVLRIFLDPFGPPLDANLLIPGPLPVWIGLVWFDLVLLLSCSSKKKGRKEGRKEGTKEVRIFYSYSVRM